MTGPRLTTPLAAPSWLTSAPCSHMAASGQQRVDYLSGRVGVPPAVGQLPGTLDTGTQVPASTSVSAGSSSPSSRSACPAGQTRGGGTTSPAIAGILRAHICRPQGDRGLAPGDRFIGSQSLPPTDPIQDGDSHIDPRGHSSQRLGHVIGPAGCVLPRTDSSPVPPLAQIHVVEPDFPVPCSSIWSVTQPMGVHPRDTGSSHRSEAAGHPNSDVPRRLAHPRSVSGCLPVSDTRGVSRGGVSGLLPQLGQVRFVAVPVVCLSGHGVRLPCAERTSESNSHPATSHVAEPSPLSASGLSETNHGPSGHDGELGATAPTRPSSQTAPPACSGTAVVSSPRLLGRSDCTRGLVSSVHSTVARSVVVTDGSPSGRHCSAAPAIHGRFVPRMGSSRSGLISSGGVDDGSSPPSHQPSGNGRSGTRSPVVPAVPSLEGGPTMYGQHHRRLLPQQARGSALHVSLPQSGRDTVILPVAPHPACGTPRPGQNEHSGRRAQPTSHATSHRVDASTCDSGTDLGAVVSPARRSVCDTVQPQTPSVRESGSGPSGVGSGRTVHQLGRSAGLRLPTLPDRGSCASQVRDRPPHDDSHRTEVAGAALVSRPAATLPRVPSSSSDRTQGSSATSQRRPACQSTGPTPSRLASLRSSLLALGASDDVVGLIDSSRRLSTHSVYGTYWNRWIAWADARSFDPLRPTDVQLANFLANLFVRLKLALNTVKGFRSAITSTIAQLGGGIQEVSHNPHLLRDLIRGATLRDARTPRRTPAWDLVLVLASLREAPYEPLGSASLKFLSFKTAFLLTLASGRRGSEVHAISGLAADIAFERNGGISLHFLPEFLAKNQVPGAASPTLVIPALTSILCPDDADRLLCPVRALKFYLDRTSQFRSPSHRRLFISYNVEYDRDISLQTLSRWLREVIKQAYGSSHIQITPRVHEIRAWSASLAFKHSVPLNVILEAAFWRSHSTFTHFYLRDVRRLRHDGTFGVASAVVAQSALSST